MPLPSSSAKRNARKIVDARDGHWCRMCGISVTGRVSSVHHRINRGMGGSSLRERASILVRVCGTGTTGCHGWIGANPTTAELTGWSIPKLNPDLDPEQVPLLTASGWALLDDTGSITPCPAPAGPDGAEGG